MNGGLIKSLRFVYFILFYFYFIDREKVTGIEALNRLSKSGTVTASQKTDLIGKGKSIIICTRYNCNNLLQLTRTHPKFMAYYLLLKHRY